MTRKEINAIPQDQIMTAIRKILGQSTPKGIQKFERHDPYKPKHQLRYERGFKGHAKFDPDKPKHQRMGQRGVVNLEGITGNPSRTKR